jgi:hypothetical protein
MELLNVEESQRIAQNHACCNPQRHQGHAAHAAARECSRTRASAV